MKRCEYFWMRAADLCEEETTVADVPKNYDSFAERAVSGNKNTIDAFRNLGEIPCVFKVYDGVICDYLPNVKGYPLMSARLKETIDANIKIKLHRWLKAKIKDMRTKEIIVYYMPLFENFVDAIDYEKSKYIGEHEDRSLIVPCFSLKKIKDLDFFPKHNGLDDKRIGEKYPYLIDSYLVVSKKLKNIIRKNKLTGIKFEKEWVENDL